MPDYRRPLAAARAIGVSRSTLEGWVRGGLVGHARIGRVAFVNLDDCRELIAAHEERRRVVPYTAERMPATPSEQLEAARAYLAGSPAPTAQQHKGRRR